ncbi:MAG: transposase [Pirellulaceae bacterium]|nr:transposase [Pirellulaceae bacterium]
MNGKQKPSPPKIMEVDQKQLDELLEHAEAGQALSKEECQLLRAAFGSLSYLQNLLSQKNISIARLRKLLFGASTETTKAVLGEEAEGTSPPAGVGSGEEAGSPSAAPEATPKPPPPGHGRNGADAYWGAEKIQVTHDSLHPGDGCPECQEGTLYQMAQPATLIRIVGQAPVPAKIYELQRLRCNLCGKVFTAQVPQDAGADKYDITVASMIGLLKYGTGMPFNRVEGLQGSLGVPLPASTQWKLVAEAAPSLRPAHEELIRQGAQGDLVSNDDTTNRILERMGKRLEKAEAKKGSAAESEEEDHKEDEEKDPQRRGIFTSGIVCSCAGHLIALFFTGWKHAGENLRDVLVRRAVELGPPIQMCDALSRNLPGELKTILAHCLAHARRKFADVVQYFGQEVRYVLKALAVIYKNDADARKQKLSPEARLQWHQAKSASVMKELHEWLTRQSEDRLVEPNSGLGQAISYMLKHWSELTLFLRQAGAPLDNNVCERALKKVILHRKNAMFYLTDNGAQVGDMYMSLIYTCQLCGANPFDYLTELQRHAPQVAAHPQNWMPWNYRQTIDGVTDTTPLETIR